MKFTYEKPGAEPIKREILAPGWYDFKITRVHDKDREGDPLVTTSGTPYLKLVCTESVTRAPVYHFLFMSQDSARKISALIHACALEVESGEEIQLTARTFEGKSFRGKAETEKGHDETIRNKITWVKRIDHPEVPSTEIQPQKNKEGGETSLFDEEPEDDQVPF